MNTQPRAETLSYPQWLLHAKHEWTHRGGGVSHTGDNTFRSSCEFCPIDGSKLSVIGDRTEQTLILAVVPFRVRVSDCAACGWWQLLVEDGTSNDAGYEFVKDSSLLSAVLRHLNPNPLSDGPLESLREYLHRHPERIGDLHPEKMERLVADVFKSHFNCDVRHVGRSGDGGIDLLMIQGDEISAVQVKRREISNQCERVSIVRELVGAMVAYGLAKGKVVTTADRFGPTAQLYVEQVRKRKFDIELVDGESFLAILNAVHLRAERPWMSALDEIARRRGSSPIPNPQMVREYCRSFQHSTESPN